MHVSCWSTFEDNQVFPTDSHLLTLDTGRGEYIQDGADWEWKETQRQQLKVRNFTPVQVYI